VKRNRNALAKFPVAPALNPPPEWLVAPTLELKHAPTQIINEAAEHYAKLMRVPHGRSPAYADVASVLTNGFNALQKPWTTGTYLVATFAWNPHTKQLSTLCGWSHYDKGRWHEFSLSPHPHSAKHVTTPMPIHLFTSMFWFGVKFDPRA